ncbi:hypothetical protein PSYPI_18741 [Pseudomonas syringae pv. pisi str. 1704B]|uniref:Uncharacterized protein n=1 Tax=Pseudomonas syringae pv. pisi str. 1704B TaxID=629263 RepID=F3GB57_PSESJ|nr:hypothetical protein PSYPI_18741 [Pseudomonas syringae pv. pisi str. 1704B]
MQHVLHLVNSLLLVTILFLFLLDCKFLRLAIPLLVLPK